MNLNKPMFHRKVYKWNVENPRKKLIELKKCNRAILKKNNLRFSDAAYDEHFKFPKIAECKNCGAVFSIGECEDCGSLYAKIGNSGLVSCDTCNHPSEFWVCIECGYINRMGETIYDIKSGCFIATATYGSYNAPEVIFYRMIRDRFLMDNICGRMFVNMYYALSPSIAEKIHTNKKLRVCSKKFLDKVKSNIESIMLILGFCR